MDEPILDAICTRIRQSTYIKGSRILSHGAVVDKMLFVVRGKLESIGEDGTRIPLSEGDACGEELLTWYLEHSSVSTGIAILSCFCFSHVSAFRDNLVQDVVAKQCNGKMPDD